jgi:predicted MFS family arabinose efflux permease
MSSQYNAGASTPAPKPSARAWAILWSVYLLSLVISLIWFSIPPLHNPIAGLVVDGTVRVVPGYTHFANAIAAHNFAVMADFGLLMSMLSTFALIAAILAAPLTRALSVKVTVIIGAICIVASCFVAALSGSSFQALLASRIISGLGVGFIMVSSPTVISLWFSDKNRALAVAIWSTCVPLGIILVSNTAIPITATFGDFHAIWWIIGILGTIGLVFAFVVVRVPQKEESLEVTAEVKTFKEILPILKQRQLIMVTISWVVFCFVNYVLGTYNVAFFGSELHMSPAMANMWSGIASGAAITAPIFGLISDKLPRSRKYLLIVVGSLLLALASATAFKASGGMALFAVYLPIQFLANTILVATCRPMVPLLVGRGGVTAVSFGLSLFAFLQYGSQMFTPLFGKAIDTYGYSTATWMVTFPIAVIGFITACFVKPASDSSNRAEKK